ncbi:MAG: ribosomal protein S18-alanine N-acetyltransferase [Porticoccaceae bacterium]|nr:ribosomal protein S18-alanine N-acetyltransferase [Porticoccaceae bacterium]
MSQLAALNLASANSPSIEAKGLLVQKMSADDLAQVVAIEQLASANPWSSQQFADCMHSTVLLIDKQLVVGFAVLALVADQAELHNIAIHPDRQGQGLGTVFLNALIKAIPTVIKMFYLEVRVTNYRAIRLYYQLGFAKIGERRGYYRSELGSEDALVMCKILSFINK